MNDKKRIDMQKKWALLREKRIEKIYDYLEDHKQSDHTAYSISKALNIALSTVQQLLKLLFEDRLIIFDQKVENNILKKIVRIKRANEFIFTDLSENNPKLDFMINKAHEKGLSVWIHRIGGTKYEIKKEQENENTR